MVADARIKKYFFIALGVMLMLKLFSKGVVHKLSTYQ
jgi:hypothetical protein